ncbi:MAG: hypothetical protein A2142_07340 [candidate division Zixibacteria bacterium RBG_16_48_11]|nr:MAG: hypothetical protein A2142_07340 [candidate division Zixibacteria bacterium RBG_16_48_11]
MIADYEISSLDVLTEESLKPRRFSSETGTTQTQEYERILKGPKINFSPYWKLVSNNSASFVKPTFPYNIIEFFESAATFQQQNMGNVILIGAEYLTAIRKLQELKRRHFTDKDRFLRITLANAALDRSLINYTLDKETWRWIAEDVDLEDL